MNTQYTVVQHSAWAANQDPIFKDALESASVTKGEATKVRKVGGVLFDSYTEAEDYADAENFQPDNSSIVPNVPGTFAKFVNIGGRAVYIPKGDTA